MRLFLACAAVLVSCENSKTSDSKIETEKDESVLLFNTSEFSRSEIANFITQIDNCGPVVIGLTDIFDGLNNREEDSLLAKAIMDSKKVVLSADIAPETDKSLIRSHNLFVGAAKAQGVTSYLQNENGIVDTFIPLYQDSEGQETNTSFSLFFEYASKKAAILFEKLNVNERYSLLFKDKRIFPVIDPKKISCEEIKGKIVIMGYLGPDKENMVNVETDEGDQLQIYVPILIANQLSNFLNQETLIEFENE